MLCMKSSNFFDDQLRIFNDYESNLFLKRRYRLLSKRYYFN